MAARFHTTFLEEDSVTPNTVIERTLGMMHAQYKRNPTTNVSRVVSLNVASFLLDIASSRVVEQEMELYECILNERKRT